MRWDLLAAMKADSLPVPGGAQLVTDVNEESGKMTVLEDTDGAWRAVRIEEPRRGQVPD
jgi:hypothetical protein